MSWEATAKGKTTNIKPDWKEREKGTDNSRNVKVLGNFDDDFKVDGRKERKS